jgi:hypothetical protein
LITLAHRSDWRSWNLTWTSPPKRLVTAGARPAIPRDRSHRQPEAAQAKREPSARGAGTDAAKAAAWRSWFTVQVREAVKAMARSAGEALADARAEVADQLAERDRKIKKLEVEFAKAQAEIAKLQVRTAQVDVDLISRADRPTGHRSRAHES